jgi:hypothetical protein
VSGIPERQLANACTFASKTRSQPLPVVRAVKLYRSAAEASPQLFLNDGLRMLIVMAKHRVYVETTTPSFYH